jgi:tetratricopeptide (TPR) repeat protein
MGDVTADYSSPALRADLEWFASVLDLANGRIGAAEMARVRAVEAERAAPEASRRPGFHDVTEWFAATLPLPYADSTLMRVGRRAASAQAVSGGPKAAFENEMGMGTPIQLEPLRQYTLGTISLRLRDTVSAASAAGKLQRLAASGSATALTRDLDRGFRARLVWREGRPEEALRLLDSLESEDSQGDIAVIPFVSRANERYLRAELLASLGRNAEALQWFASLGSGSVTEIPLRALSELRQAEIHERLGHRDQATAHYARFLESWRDADREFQSFADTARRRLADLTRKD